MQNLLPFLLPYAIFMSYVVSETPRECRNKFIVRTTGAFVVLISGKLSVSSAFDFITTIFCIIALMHMTKQIQETGDG